MQNWLNVKFEENQNNMVSRDVADIYVYDEEGNRVAVLDSLKRTEFKEGKGCMYLQVVDALMNIPFFEFVQDASKKEKVEPKFDELFSLKKTQEEPLLVIPVKRHADKDIAGKRMSLVFATTYRNRLGEDKQVFYKIPNVIFTGFRGLEGNPYGITYYFTIDYTEQGTFYDLIIEK